MFKQQIEPAILEDAQVSVIYQSKHLPMVTITGDENSINQLRNHPNIVSIEKDVQIQLEKPQDIFSQENMQMETNDDRSDIYLLDLVEKVTDWGTDRLKLDEAWSSDLDGTGVKIAVFDTGISKKHEDLTISGGASFVPNTNSYNDDNGHGTHVAGIIAARNNQIGVTGAAYNADIYAVKVLDATGEGQLSYFIAAIDWAIDHDIDIVNMSFGSVSGSETLEAALNRAYQEGIRLVAAAGNEGGVVNYPASYSSVIAMSATNINDQRPDFSNFGEQIEYAAPGDMILSTYLDNNYVRMTGTSMSTPYVSGTLALFKQAYPYLSNDELRLKLRENAVDIGHLGRDRFYGFGLIQAPHSTSDIVREDFQYKEATNKFYFTETIKDIEMDEENNAVYVLTEKQLIQLDKETYEVIQEKTYTEDLFDEVLSSIIVDHENIYLLSTDKLYFLEKDTLSIQKEIDLERESKISIQNYPEFELQNGKFYITANWDQLIIIDKAKRQTGFLEAYLQNYNETYFSWIDKGYLFNYGNLSKIIAKVISKSDRFAKVEIQFGGGLSTNYLKSFYTGKMTKGKYYLKKSNEGQWQLYNFVSYQ